MNAKIRPTNIYTTKNSNRKAKGEGHYTLDDEVNPSQQEKQKTTAIELFNVTSITVESNIECHQK
jgi:hypothetical protein